MPIPPGNPAPRLSIRYTALTDRAARFDVASGELVLDDGIGAQTTALVLADVARALAGRATIHGRPVRHLRAVTA